MVICREVVFKTAVFVENCFSNANGVVRVCVCVQGQVWQRVQMQGEGHGEDLGSQGAEGPREGQGQRPAGGGHHEQAGPPQAAHAVGRLRGPAHHGARHGIVSSAHLLLYTCVCVWGGGGVCVCVCVRERERESVSVCV